MTTPPESDSGTDIDKRCEAFVAAYDEALVNGSSVPDFDDTTLPTDLLPQLRGLRECLDVLAEGRRSGELARALASCRLVGDSLDVDDLPICERIGPFEIRRELGRGGYGVVFLAFDSRMGRLVALKVPRPEALVTPELRRRFLREAEAGGGLAHPNLVAVYEVGEDGPLCYIASNYCGGPTLAAWLSARQRPVPCDDAATAIAALADGLEYAHRHGVLHRDIKPSNVLLDPRESASEPGALLSAPLTAFTPRLTDFGMAKLLERNDDETYSGMLLGTPAYMAPCQANGQAREASAATDVYGLGVVLYELLTGQAPFRGANVADTLRQVCLNDPSPPSRVRPDLSRDLEAICLKCLAKAPVSRYASAADLARDLRRYLAGEPTWARPVHTLEKLAKWGRRHPAVASLSTILLVGALLSSIGGWWYSAQLSRALSDNQHFLYTASINLAERALANGDILQTQAQLARGVPALGEPDLRDFTWHHLSRLLNEEERTFSGHAADIYCVRYSPNGKLLGTASKDGTARVWDITSGRCLHVLRGHSGEVNSIAFSPDNACLASAGDDGMVCIWDLKSAKVQHTFTAHPVGVYVVAYSPDGRRLASCGRDRNVILWDTSSWQQTAVLVGHEDDVGTLVFSPGGETIATGSDDRTVRLWDAVTSHAKATLRGHGSDVNSLAFSADGRQLVTSGREDRTVRIWDVSTGQEKKIVSRQHDWIHAVRFCQRDSQVAVATKDGELEIIDVATGEIVRRLYGHGARIWSVAISPDGCSLADASADGTAKTWSLVRGASHDVLREGNHASSSVRMTPDGFSCLTGGGDVAISSWDVAARQLRWRVGRDFEITGDFNGDGAQDGGYFQDGLWYLRMAAGSGEQQQYTEQLLRFGAIGDTPVVGDWDGDGRDNLGVYRPEKGTWYLDLDGAGGIPESELEFGQAKLGAHLGRGLFPMVGKWDGQPQDRIGLASFRDGVWWFHLDRGEDEIDIAIERNDQSAVPVAWNSSSGAAIGVANSEGVWTLEIPKERSQDSKAGERVDESLQPEDAEGGKADTRFVAHKRLTIPVESLDAAKDRATAAVGYDNITFAISPQGTVLASAEEDNDSRVKLWDVRTGRRLAVLRHQKDLITRLAFAPHGSTLAVGDRTGAVTLWDVDQFQVTGTLMAHSPGGLRLAYSPDGRWLATAGDEGMVKIWAMADRSEAATLRADAPYEVQALAFSPDSKLIAVAGTNRVVTLWSRATGEAVGRLAGHTQGVTSVAFSPDGRTLASGSGDQSVRLWDLFTKQGLYTLKDGVGIVHSVAFGPTGSELVAAGDGVAGGGVLHIWSAEKRVAPSHAEPAPFGSVTRADQSAAHENHVPRTLAVDGQGNYLLSWHSARKQYDIVARRFDQSGAALGDEIVVNSPARCGNTDYGDYHPPTAMNARGDAVIAWTSHQDSFERHDVYVRRLSATGEPLGEEILVNQDRETSNRAWGVGIDDQGSFVVAYGRVLGVNENFDMDIFVRRYDAQGMPLGNESRVNTILRGPQVHCRLAMSPAGSFVVVWMTGQASGQVPGIYARRYGADGTPRKAQEFVVSPALGSGDVIGLPNVACDHAGRFVVTWTKLGDIWMNRFDEQGAPLGPAILVTGASQQHQADYSSVAVGPKGDFVICWTARNLNLDGSNAVFARLYDAAGVPRGPEFRPGGRSPGHQACACPGWVTDDGFVISWYAVPVATEPPGIFFQQFTTSAAKAR